MGHKRSLLARYAKNKSSVICIYLCDHSIIPNPDNIIKLKLLVFENRRLQRNFVFITGYKDEGSCRSG